MASLLIVVTIIMITCFARTLPHLTPIPIVALALFVAVTLPRKRSALVFFFAGLLLSDLLLGFHWMILIVYASLVPVLCMGFELKNNLSGHNILGVTVLASLIYFFLTNFAVWVLGACEWTQAREFPMTFAGLVSTFSAALPGLPKKILADLIGSSLFFGAFPLAYKTLGRCFAMRVGSGQNFG
jgi:hypothetical protein